jgi:hypothetical protein
LAFASGPDFLPVASSAVSLTASSNIPLILGRGFKGLAATVLLPRGSFGARESDRVGTDRFDGEGDLRDDGGTEVLLSVRVPKDEALVLLAGVKPKPPREALVAGFALAVPLLAADRPDNCPKLPSLVPGRLPPLLPFRLRLELGLGGGPICPGEKKLDRRLSFGVVGRPCRLSIVRSLRDGRELFFALKLGAACDGKTGSSSSAADSSCDP